MPNPNQKSLRKQPPASPSPRNAVSRPGSANPLPQRILIGLIVLLLAGWGLWSFLNRAGSVAGQVLDAQSSAPLRQAKLVLDQQTSQDLSELTSAFAFSGVKPGWHSLRAEAPGYLAETRSFNLKAGEALRLNLKLRPAQTSSKLEGDAWLIGTQSPPSLQIFAADFKLLKSIPLKGRPTDALIRGTKAYVADAAQDLLQVVDLSQGSIQDIKLPAKSEPGKLALSGNQLLILNQVGKSISLLNLDTLQIRQSPLQLAFSPRDMATGFGGELYLLGPEILATANLSFGTVEKGYALPGVNAKRLHLMPASGSFLLLGIGQLYRVNPSSGDTETIPLERGADLIEVLDDSRILLARQKQLQVFSLSQREASIPQTLDGKVVFMNKAADTVLVLTHSPNALQVLDAQTMKPKQSIPLIGAPSFARKVSFD